MNWINEEMNLVSIRVSIPLAKFAVPYKIRSIAFTNQKMYLLNIDCNIESIDLDEILKYL